MYTMLLMKPIGAAKRRARVPKPAQSLMAVSTFFPLYPPYNHLLNISYILVSQIATHCRPRDGSCDAAYRVYDGHNAWVGIEDLDAIGSHPELDSRHHEV